MCKSPSFLLSESREKNYKDIKRKTDEIYSWSPEDTHLARSTGRQRRVWSGPCGTAVSNRLMCTRNVDLSDQRSRTEDMRRLLRRSSDVAVKATGIYFNMVTHAPETGTRCSARHQLPLAAVIIRGHSVERLFPPPTCWNRHGVFTGEQQCVRLIE